MEQVLITEIGTKTDTCGVCGEDIYKEEIAKDYMEKHNMGIIVCNECAQYDLAHKVNLSRGA